MENYRIKEMKPGWISFLSNLIGIAILWNFDWRMAVGVVLTTTPIAYQIDLIRNYLRDRIK